MELSLRVFLHWDSLTNILFNLDLPRFDTGMANAAVSYWRLRNGCNIRTVFAPTWFISALSRKNDIISVHFIPVFPLCLCVSIFYVFCVLLLSVACLAIMGHAAWMKTDDDDDDDDDGDC